MGQAQFKNKSKTIQMTKQTPTQIKQHEQAYWHIPKFTILPFILAIIFGLLTYGNFQLIDKEVLHKVFSEDTCKADSLCNLVSSDLINIYPIIGEYILLSLILISIVAEFKRGYKNLKSYDEEGLIGGLIFGLIIGLIGGLISGLISGLIIGLIGGLIIGLIIGLIGGLIIGLIGGLISGLIIGLIFGLIGEFS
jgi:hypothetical protein